MTYWDLLEYIKTLKSGIGAIWKNHIFSTGPPNSRRPGNKYTRCRGSCLCPCLATGQFQTKRSSQLLSPNHHPVPSFVVQVNCLKNFSQKWHTHGLSSTYICSLVCYCPVIILFFCFWWCIRLLGFWQEIEYQGVKKIQLIPYLYFTHPISISPISSLLGFLVSTRGWGYWVGWSNSFVVLLMAVWGS